MVKANSRHYSGFTLKSQISIIIILAIIAAISGCSSTQEVTDKTSTESQTDVAIKSTSNDASGSDNKVDLGIDNRESEFTIDLFFTKNLNYRDDFYQGVNINTLEPTDTFFLGETFETVIIINNFGINSEHKASVTGTIKITSPSGKDYFSQEDYVILDVDVPLGNAVLINNVNPILTTFEKGEEYGFYTFEITAKDELTGKTATAKKTATFMRA